MLSWKFYHNNRPTAISKLNGISGKRSTKKVPIRTNRIWSPQNDRTNTRRIGQLCDALAIHHFWRLRFRNLFGNNYH
ncbi:hypothetical protein LOAG_19191 [Loa loa]|uniref:Uncharacterized protein n=1 Tax=Loa loa TaxID=7209 RepID=A0A1S0UD83_LOALO|nr:hypothetical protein LOAG_19191 [Loa loa]EJD73386.1 hypothetical protein LOAG_19191 [Loa loa]